MNAFTQIQDLVMPLPSECKGFTLTPSSQSPRLLELKFAKQTVDAFIKAVTQWPSPGSGVQIVPALPGWPDT